jgi:hypothetical protein
MINFLKEMGKKLKPAAKMGDLWLPAPLEEDNRNGLKQNIKIQQQGTVLNIKRVVF